MIAAVDRQIVDAAGAHVAEGDFDRGETPAQTAPVILLRLGPYRFLANVAAQACHLTQDGTSKFKLPGSPPSFSAWPRSPLSYSPLGEHQTRGSLILNVAPP